tara:strand:- start:6 stop:200 length:195 start_codon:yes stop_codon:yes gene_type:complete
MSNQKKYIIYVKEIHQAQFEVEASDQSEALIKAMSGDGIWLDNTTEFIETLDPDTWECEEAGDA